VFALCVRKDLFVAPHSKQLCQHALAKLFLYPGKRLYSSNLTFFSCRSVRQVSEQLLSADIGIETIQRPDTLAQDSYILRV
jgi:hypothetical protein